MTIQNTTMGGWESSGDVYKCAKKMENVKDVLIPSVILEKYQQQK
jgi:hypothetical protein